VRIKAPKGEGEVAWVPLYAYTSPLGRDLARGCALHLSQEKSILDLK